MLRGWLSGIIGPVLVAGALALAGPAAADGVAAVPHLDHVVVVVEENHGEESVVGSPDAPYINALAASGANFTRFFAETHPSQPNYLALFSGSTQGVTDDSCPHTFSGPNLAAGLIAAGHTFAGYSETQPSAGYTGCTSGAYARKHNPWVNFSTVPATADQPFSAFPTDYDALPDVSFVIPNLDNDMHDGSIAQGDAWLRQNLDGYVVWARTHNSVLVVTFDEDEGAGGNRIPTLITGAGVVAGDRTEPLDHYNLLRTIEDAYGVTPAGASATASPILDIWAAPDRDRSPVPAFTVTCAQLSCDVDASGSIDPDGSITGYAWDFGDGATARGVTATHAYAAGGAYSVRLTVTDDHGATGAAVHTATPTDPAGAPFAVDGFDRTAADGWGSADVGGTWTVLGTAARAAVADGSATFRLDRATRSEAYLSAVARTDTDATVGIAVDRRPAGGRAFVSLSTRRTGAGTSYLARALLNADGTVTLLLTRLVAGAETILARTTVGGLTVAAGVPITLRAQAAGTDPTTLRARMWRSGGTEPGDWQVSATDATGVLQAPGSVGLVGYLSRAATNGPVTLSYRGFSARPSSG